MRTLQWLRERSVIEPPRIIRIRACWPLFRREDYKMAGGGERIGGSLQNLT